MSQEIAQVYQFYLQNPVICTDSRKITQDCVFIALVGDRFDAHDFVEQALEKGAMCCVVSDKKFDDKPQCITVPNTLIFLQKLARYHRDRFDIPVLAITGSNGKTTTKELVRDVLRKKYKVHATVGNFNNHIGVPLTLLSMPQSTEFAIIEMGANHQKEIEALCEIADPNFGYITNIGLAHLEGFGGIEGVFLGKSELYRYLQQKKGHFFLNNQDEYLVKLSDISHTPIEMLHIDQSKNPTCSFQFNHSGVTETIHTQLYGAYNISNVAAAISIGKYFETPIDNIVNAIESYSPQMNRSQMIVHKQTTFVLDAYNANPSSMRASIEGMLKRKGKRMLILGSMLELGDQSEALHLGLLQWVLSCPWDAVLLVGNTFNRAYLLMNKDYGGDLHWFSTASEAADFVAQMDIEDHSILLKGSRSIGLESIFNRLVDN